MPQNKTISVGKYAKRLGVTPQVIYQRIATGKLVEGKHWEYEERTVRLKRIIVSAVKKSGAKKAIKRKQ